MSPFSTQLTLVVAGTVGSQPLSVYLYHLSSIDLAVPPSIQSGFDFVAQADHMILNLWPHR